MTNVNHNPANDFPIGSLGMDNAEDTEGHIKRGPLGQDDQVVRLEDADTEGHVVRGPLGQADEVRGRLEDADTEGHIKRGPLGQDDQVVRLEDADTEGHIKR